MVLVHLILSCSPYYNRNTTAMGRLHLYVFVRANYIKGAQTPVRYTEIIGAIWGLTCFPVRSKYFRFQLKKRKKTLYDYKEIVCYDVNR